MARVLLALWAAVGALCALGGMMFGIKAVVSPELGWELLIPAFAAMILGGNDLLNCQANAAQHMLVGIHKGQAKAFGKGFANGCFA